MTAKAWAYAHQRHVLDSLRLTGAVAFQSPDPVRITRRLPHGRVEGHLSDPVWTDIAGCLDGGRALAIECKATADDGGRWKLDPRLRAVKGKGGGQGEILRRVDEAGGVAAVVVARTEDWPRAQLFVVPWPAVEGLRDDKGALPPSISWTDLDLWRVPRGSVWTAALVEWGRYCEEGWPPPATPVYQIPLEGLAGRRLVATEAAAQAAYLESPTDEDSDSKLESLQAQLLAARRDEVRSDRLTGAAVRIGRLVEEIEALKRTRRKDR